jgi:hypothetical protein
VPHQARRKSELRGSLFDSFRVGWSVGHGLVHLPLLKAERWSVKVIDGSLRVATGRLSFSSPNSASERAPVKPDGAADWLARRMTMPATARDILEVTIGDSTGLKRKIRDLMSIGRARGIDLRISVFF